MSRAPDDGEKQLARLSDKEFARMKAEMALSPSFNAATLVQAFSLQGELPLADVVTLLGEHCKGVHGNDLRRLESMLITQAHSLNAMFSSLARRGLDQEGLKQYEAHMKLALRAQSQCRATLETLAAIKNPPVVFAKQANIAHGPQQVNNQTAGIARASETEKAPNELLEADDHGQGLDTGATRPAGTGHQELATVEAVHRPTHERGEGQRKP